MSTSDTRCPLCRSPRQPVPDVAFEALAKTSGVTFRCNTCQTSVAAAECEYHRAWCAAHRFVCPCTACTTCVTARDMVAHVRTHDGTLRLTQRVDGTHHAVVALARGGGDSCVFCLDRAVVVLTNTGGRYTHPPWVTPSTFSLQLRAYYDSADAPAVLATIRQLRVLDCDSSNNWVEEHRYGVVSPMLASQEHVIVAHNGPVLTPRCVLTDALPLDAPVFAFPDVPPGKVLSTMVRRHGLRDLPLPSYTETMRSEASTPACIVHLVLRYDVDGIGETWPI